ncbi:MAG: ABC transporter substrate-binding protein [Rhodospirillales bacterium]|nr:ABC transporter substrate-binding protein [Rhodospirillales bacterium]
MHIRKTTLSILGAAAMTMAASGTASAEGKVEVIHWWTSGGEAAALNVLKQNLEKQGIGWIDGAVAGGGGDQARTVLKARVAAGNPPTTMQQLGFAILDFADAELLGNLNDLAAKEGWDAVVPDALKKFVRPDGTWVAAPVNVHTTNWVWANKAIFDKVGVEAPTTWDEFVAAADKIKAAGITPIAWGGQAWQEATVVDALINSTGGTDFYKKAIVEMDQDALKSDTMVEVFKRLRKLNDYVDPNYPNRDWNLATAMVINGEAAMQMMGDWAKGEFINAKKVPNEDFLCFRFPGTQGSVTFNSDAFAMFKVGDDAKGNQMALASAIMSPEFQEAFNIVKGSAPARIDVSGANFDACGQKAIKQLAEAAKADKMMGSMAHGHGVPEAVKGAMYDVITSFFSSDMSAEEAVQKLADGVALAQ